MLLAGAISGLLACSRQSQPPPEAAYRKAREAFQRGELLSALNEADFSLKRYEKRGDPDWTYRFRILKAEVLMYRGQSKESLRLLEPEVPASLALDEIAVRRSMVQGLANAYLQQFEPAENHLREAERLCTGRHSDLLGEIALYHGVLELVRGNLPEAELRFRQALQLARERKQPFQEANALNNLGLVYMRRQQFGEAIDWFNASHELAGRLGYRMLDSKLSGNRGWCYLKLGDYENALGLFTEAETLATQLGIDRDQLTWQTNIGSVHYEQREFTEAERDYKDALEIARKLDNKAQIAICLNNLAATSLESARYDLAEKYNREALQLKRAIGDKTSELYSVLNDGKISAGRHNYPSAIEVYQRVIRGSGTNVSLRWEAEANLAETYVQQDKPALADQLFRKAVATVDAARAVLVKEEYRLSFLTTAANFYDAYIDFLVSNGRVREALEVAEHSRARTLAEGLGLKNVVAPNGFRPEQASRETGGVILSYWLKPERSYLWAVTPSKVALFELPAETEINSEVEAYRKALAGPRDVLETANPHGQNLYRALVAPAQKLIVPGAHVTIIADGALHGLNFETLLVPGARLHYWIEDVVIANANSIALLAAPQPKARRQAGQLLLIGNPVSPQAEFPSLAHADVEIERVQEHFLAGQRVMVTGNSATPRAYSQNEPRRFAYIHFVAHGTASRTAPLDSGIILSREGDTYKLYAHDIMQQPLRAELVTISACYGAGTRAYSGEGLVGLSWAFLRAGAHHVIAALWEVNDTSTPQLMGDLYRGLSQGQSPAVALRSAKLNMLHSDSVFRRPFYWAAFQLYTGS